MIAENSLQTVFTSWLRYPHPVGKVLELASAAVPPVASHKTQRTPSHDNSTTTIEVKAPLRKKSTPSITGTEVIVRTAVAIANAAKVK